MLSVDDGATWQPLAVPQNVWPRATASSTSYATASNVQFFQLAANQAYRFAIEVQNITAGVDLANARCAHVVQVVQLVDALLGVDAAYVVGGTVFFRAPDDLDRHGAYLLAIGA